MFCHNCGIRLTDNSSFCHKCGTKINVETSEQRIQTTDTRNNSEQIQTINTGNNYNQPIKEIIYVKDNKNTKVVITIVLSLFVFILLLGLISMSDYTSTSSSATTRNSQSNQLNGTYSDSLGMFEFSFRGNTVSITMFGMYFGDAKYKISGNKLTLIDFELLGLGYVSNGETSLSYRKDGDSIFLEDIRLKLQ